MALHAVRRMLSWVFSLRSIFSPRGFFWREILMSLVLPSCLSFPYWTGVSGPENLYVFRMYSLIECLSCVTGLLILRLYCGLFRVDVLGISLPSTKTLSSGGSSQLLR